MKKRGNGKRITKKLRVERQWTLRLIADEINHTFILQLAFATCALIDGYNNNIYIYIFVANIFSLSCSGGLSTYLPTNAVCETAVPHKGGVNINNVIIRKEPISRKHF